MKTELPMKIEARYSYLPENWTVAGAIYKREDIKPLDALFEDVRKFHKAFGHAAPDSPVLLTEDRINKRAKWIDEETQEMRDAKTIVDQADACIDQIYFAVGTLVELGIRPGKLWEIVQGANMAKLGPDGKPLYHPDGKTKKPEGWQAPEPLLEAEVKRQMYG
jgi:predicted HAD superfamily Cof-like phosphohydrolase